VDSSKVFGNRFPVAPPVPSDAVSCRLKSRELVTVFPAHGSPHQVDV